MVDQGDLGGYFVLLATARWYLDVPSGGVFFLAEMTCILESYDTITTPWGGMLNRLRE